MSDQTGCCKSTLLSSEVTHILKAMRLYQTTESMIEYDVWHCLEKLMRLVQNALLEQIEFHEPETFKKFITLLRKKVYGSAYTFIYNACTQRNSHFERIYTRFCSFHYETLRACITRLSKLLSTEPDSNVIIARWDQFQDNFCQIFEKFVHVITSYLTRSCFVIRDGEPMRLTWTEVLHVVRTDGPAMFVESIARDRRAATILYLLHIQKRGFLVERPVRGFASVSDEVIFGVLKIGCPFVTGRILEYIPSEVFVDSALKSWFATHEIDRATDGPGTYKRLKSHFGFRYID